MRWFPAPALVPLFVMVVPVLAQPQQRPIVNTAEPPLADSGVQPAAAQVPNYDPQIAPSAAPTLTVTVIAPSYIAHGKDIDYRIRVENVTGLAAAGVQVTHALPKGAKLMKADPKQSSGDAELVWALGTMTGGSRREIQLTVSPPPDLSEWNHSATVRFEHTRQAKTKIARPELAVAIRGPKELQQFDLVTLRLEVTNPGLMEVKDVQANCTLPDGVIHDYDAPLPGRPQDAKNDPKQRSWSIPRLGPREVRYFDFRVIGQKPGAVAFLANVASAGGQKAEGKFDSIVQAPKLELTVAGPGKRAAHQSAVYRVSVRNSGTHLMRNVAVTDTLPPNCDVVSSSDNGQIFDREVQWIIPMLHPGETKILELTMRSAQSGRMAHAFAAKYRGHKVTAEAVTDIDATAALRLDIQGSALAVELNGTVRYTVAVENTGSAPGTNARVTLSLPDALTLVSCDPNTARQEGQRVVFDPTTIPMNGRQSFIITAKAVRPASPATVQVELTADQLEAGPLRRQESTQITSGS